jgi:DNA helicase-2/ATP-dependent DNA helicase PcrA
MSTGDSAISAEVKKKFEDALLAGLTKGQGEAVKSEKRRVLIVAGAGSGKTEVMARRIAWLVAVEGVPKDTVVAFTFTERAAEELKFRIRNWIGEVTEPGKDVALGSMYIGTIHGFCLAKLREYWPDDYHNFDVLDESSRAALVLRGFNGVLGLSALRAASRTGQFQKGQYDTFDDFAQAYDQLHEHGAFDVKLASGAAPFELGAVEREWCAGAALKTDVGDTPAAKAFAMSAARYYAYLRCRRFLDFSTSQSEFVLRLKRDGMRRVAMQQQGICLVVDEVQDINPIQLELINVLIGETGRLSAVGDHRQSIYGFRGAKVEIIGRLWEKFSKAVDGEVVDLQENFRSTPRIVGIANKWADTIGQVGKMKTRPMLAGNDRRHDQHPSHVALVSFDERQDEAAWIAKAIRVLVPHESNGGARHDKRGGGVRGLSLSDVALLVRSSTDVRTYMDALNRAGIACVVKAGPDLFSQPEVLLFLSALAVSGGHEQFVGSPINPKSMPCRIQSVLGCGPDVQSVYRSAADAVRRSGLPLDKRTEERLLAAAGAIFERIRNEPVSADRLALVRNEKLRVFLRSSGELRRVFPQQIFHMLLAEGDISLWDSVSGRGQSALYHLGALSGLVTGLETPGWTSAKDYSWQLIALFQHGTAQGRAEEQPLMVQPDAVTVSTVHAAKGLEFPAVFLADVNARRFPSQMARRAVQMPLSGRILETIDVESLHDNDNYDGERRLMYVALTRAERFLFVSHSGKQTSRFVKELQDVFAEEGAVVTSSGTKLLSELEYSPKEHQRDIRLSTSFSDLRYYLECPHDFYLRKVLGFAPTIDQAFGYGRGVHNLMRAIHSDPKRWAALASKPDALKAEVERLVNNGLFYLRYTTGDPASRMRAKGIDIVSDYVVKYAGELASLQFEPEKPFETLIQYDDGQGGALVTGAIDVIRQDNPPRVTLIDFKSGDAESDGHQKLDTEEMQLQVALYALAAKKELEYQPDLGLVRYLGEPSESKSELQIPLDEATLAEAKKTVAVTAARIRDRKFEDGPRAPKDGPPRCSSCDFNGFCGTFRRKGGKPH